MSRHASDLDSTGGACPRTTRGKALAGEIADRPVAVFAELGIATRVQVARLPLEAEDPIEASRDFEDTLDGEEIDVACGLAALGHSVRLGGVTGGDRLGQIALALAKQRGLDTSHVRCDRPRTARSMTLLDSTAQCRRVDAPAPAARYHYPSEELEQVIEGCEWVLVPAVNWCRPVARLASEMGRKIVLDVRTVSGLSHCHRDLLDSAHLVLLATECLTVDAHELMRRIWSTHDVEVVVATHGTAGATLAVRRLGAISWLPAPEPAQPADSTCAETAFSIGLLAAAVAGRSWPEAIACGQCVSACAAAEQRLWTGQNPAGLLQELLCHDRGIGASIRSRHLDPT